MALKATIFKAELNIADMDRDYYGDHSLTIARHPSETDERMMVRLLAFARHAHERLQFTKGLSADDEPDVWQKSLSDEIEVWIDVGQPDEKRIRKACNRSQRTLLYVYGGRGADLWWQQNAPKLERFDNLTVFNLPKNETDELAQLAQRNMRLQCTLQDNQAWLNDGERTVQINPIIWQNPDA
jgi:uncharacterized protein YaeQ